MMKRVLCVGFVVALLLGMAVCSASASALLYGDVTGDGRINNRDLGILQQYLADMDVTLDLAMADVTADGRVNNRDLGLLQQYLADMDVTLGPDEPQDEPQVELPSAGYDPDPKGRGRIIVDSVTLEDNVVSVRFVNTTTRWMSEETSYLKYICTDAEGNELTTDAPFFGTLYFGMLEAGQSVVKTFVLPEGTTKVSFGESYIIFWTQWA